MQGLKRLIFVLAYIMHSLRDNSNAKVIPKLFNSPSTDTVVVQSLVCIDSLRDNSNAKVILKRYNSPSTDTAFVQSLVYIVSETTPELYIPWERFNSPN